MYGKIYFDTIDELASFLKSFTGSTAIFEVNNNGSKYCLEFTGGY